MFDIKPYLREFVEKDVRTIMSRDGYYIFQEKIPTSTCQEMRQSMDRMAESEDVEVNYAGSEHRIWHAATKNSEFLPFMNLSNVVIPELYGRRSPAHNVLAIRNHPAPPEAERFDVRWHLDSFQRQLKLFGFLTDVSLNNGPLELVPGTHTKRFKYRHAFELGYYGLDDLVGFRRGKRKWQRIHNDTITKVESKGYKATPITVPAGTLVLADTSALHRARPCVEGERYAVTVYHR